MKISNISKLLSIASEPEMDPPPRLGEEGGALAGRLVSSLVEMLAQKNGFYAFESALHVFPAGTAPSMIGIDEWNAPETWRYKYGGLAQGCLFFAEDIFGGQFCIYKGQIYTFDPETGDKELIASNLEQWAGEILANYQVLTGYPLAHAWQKRNGPISRGQRLLPKQPFVLGGDFSVANLYLLDAIKGMRFRGDLATQLQGLQDGATVRLKTVE